MQISYRQPCFTMAYTFSSEAFAHAKPCLPGKCTLQPLRLCIDTDDNDLLPWLHQTFTKSVHQYNVCFCTRMLLFKNKKASPQTSVDSAKHKYQAFAVGTPLVQAVASTTNPFRSAFLVYVSMSTVISYCHSQSTSLSFSEMH